MQVQKLKRHLVSKIIMIIVSQNPNLWCISGNGALFIEKFIERPRHIEVQLLGMNAISIRDEGLKIKF